MKKKNQTARKPKAAGLTKDIGMGFIGFGRMGNALVSGALKAKVVKGKNIYVYDPDDRTQLKARDLKINYCRTIQELYRKSKFIFLCVKPQMMMDVLAQIKAETNSFITEKCIVSIAAGFPLFRMESELGPSASLIRVMPNTPALLGGGMSALARGESVRDIDFAQVEKIFKAVGDVVTVPENKMDAITAISGSGPAYVFYLAESMMQAAQSFGFSEADAATLVHQTIYGAGLMLKERTFTAQELREQVTSPGGTTAAAIRELERSKLKDIIFLALDKARQRSVELSQL
jgi:pyrroline-5-carboxylate reductase